MTTHQAPTPGTLLRTLALCGGLLCAPIAASLPDVPACNAIQPGVAMPLALGIVQPGAGSDVLDYAARLANLSDVSSADASLHVCQESWREVLPVWAPWGSALERGHAYLIFALAGVLVLVLLARFTPARWWRRPTALGLGGMVLGGWALGVGLLAAFHALGGQQLIYGTVVSISHANGKPHWHSIDNARDLDRLLQQAGWSPPQAAPQAAPQPSSSSNPNQAATESSEPRLPPAPAQTTAPEPQPAMQANPATASTSMPAGVVPGHYRVHHPLNLRTGPGVGAELIRVLQAGGQVHFEGHAQGDWWQVTTADGSTGWVSSLWLRRIMTDITG